MLAYSPSPFPLPSSLILSFLSPVCSFTSLHFIISFSFPSSSYPSLILPLISSSLISILSPSPLFILLFRHFPSSYRLLAPSFSFFLHLLYFLLELSLILPMCFFCLISSPPLPPSPHFSFPSINFPTPLLSSPLSPPCLLLSFLPHLSLAISGLFCFSPARQIIRRV